MSDPKLTGDTAEQIINLLRDNPGVSMTLSDISDELGMDVAVVAAHMTDLTTGRSPLFHDITPDGVDVYSFPADYQRGSTAV